jgi:hypothetical protein
MKYEIIFRAQRRMHRNVGLNGNVDHGQAEGLLYYIGIFRISLLGCNMVSGDVTYGQIVIVTTTTCNFQPLIPNKSSLYEG